jgi:hypothetical protein
LVESSSRPPAVSRESPATSAFCLLAITVAVAPCSFRGNSPIEPRASHEVIHRFFHRFHPLRYSCILQYRRLSPTSPQKGDSFSDPSSFGLQKFNSNLSIESPSCSRAIHRLILVAVAPLQVLKRGIVSPIHVSSLVLQPRRHPLHRNFFKSFSNHLSANPQCRYRSLAVKSSKGG